MFLLINLKTYRAGTGSNAEKIARQADEIASETTHEVVIAPQNTDIPRLNNLESIQIYAQHIDPVKYGSNTGSELAETICEAGADGTLLNHSEKRMKLADIDKSIDAARRADLDIVTCANNPRQVEAVTSLEPDYVAVEPPELIGTGKSVSVADPDIIRDAAAKIPDNSNTDLLCGAGITDGEDVEKALELGAEGVLIASGVVKSDTPAEVIKDLLP